MAIEVRGVRVRSRDILVAPASVAIRSEAWVKIPHYYVHGYRSDRETATLCGFLVDWRWWWWRGTRSTPVREIDCPGCRARMTPEG